MSDDGVNVAAPLTTSIGRLGWLSRGDILAVAGILAVTTTLAVHWVPRTVWTPDSLFYQARVVEIRGASQQQALSEVWNGPLAASLKAADQQRPPGDRVFSDPEWISYSAQLFERRLTVPLMAAAIYPIAGTDSLTVVSVVAFFVFAVLLYVLLHQRLSPLACGIAVSLCLAWPPTRWALLPLTDSWGLAFICLALLAALLAIERGGVWYWVWGAAVLALAFTRDLTPVPIAAAGVLLLVSRDRRAALLGVIGLAAAVPALLLGGTPLREQLAYSYNDSRIPLDSSWSFVAHHYFSELVDGLRGTGDYLLSTDPRYLSVWLPLLPFTIPIVAGITVIVLARARDPGDAFLPLMRGALIGGLAYYLLLPHFHFLRYELVFLPVAAAGLAAGIDLVRRWARDRPGQREAEVGPLDGVAVPRAATADPPRAPVRE